MYGVVGLDEGEAVSSTGRSAEVRLSIPADSAYIAVPRSVVGNLAARNDFTLDAIDDLRIAVDEACALLLPQATDGVLTCVFEIDPPQLFDLQADPNELDNLAARPEHAGLVAAFMEKVRARWNMAQFDAAVRESQARRWVVYPALRNGAYYPWEFQPLQRASERYMRNHMDLNVLEESKRFPRGE